MAVKVYKDQEEYLKSLRAETQVSPPPSFQDTPLYKVMSDIKAKNQAIHEQKPVYISPQSQQKKTIYYNPPKAPSIGRGLGYIGESFGKGIADSFSGLGMAALATSAQTLHRPGYGAMPKQFNDTLKVTSHMAAQKAAADQGASNEKFQNKYQNMGGGWQFAGAVSQGIGGMLPTIAANVVVPGAGLPVLFGSAMGNKTGEALREGASMDKAVLAGALSGGVEVATEKMFGFIPKFGKGFADDVVKSLFKSSAGQVVAESLGEGAEEYVSEIADAYISQIYNSDKRDPIRTFMETQPDAFYAALVGTVTSAVLEGSTTIKLPKKPKTDTSKTSAGDVLTPPQVNDAQNAQNEVVEDDDGWLDDTWDEPIEKPHIPLSTAQSEYKERPYTEMIDGKPAYMKEQLPNQSEQAMPAMQNPLLARLQANKRSSLQLSKTQAENLSSAVTQIAERQKQASMIKQNEQGRNQLIENTQQRQARYEVNLLNDCAKDMEVSAMDKALPAIKQASKEIESTGQVSQRTASNVFDAIYAGTNGEQRAWAQYHFNNRFNQYVNSVAGNVRTYQKKMAEYEAQVNALPTVNQQAQPEPSIPPMQKPPFNVFQALERHHASTANQAQALHTQASKTDKQNTLVPIQPQNTGLVGQEATATAEHIPQSEKSKKVQRNIGKSLFTRLTSDIEIFDDKAVKASILKASKEIKANGHVTKPTSNQIFDSLYPLSEEFRESYRQGFDMKMNDFIREMQSVAKYDLEAHQNKVEKQLPRSTLSKDEMKEMYLSKERHERMVESAMNNILLTTKEKISLDRMLKNEISIEDIPKNQNRVVIQKAYDISKPLHETKTAIEENRKQIHKKRRSIAAERIKGMELWGDKAKLWFPGLRFMRETAERNMQDIMTKEEAAAINAEYFEPIHSREAARNRFMTLYRDKIRAMNLTSEESMLVQQLGEGKIQETDLRSDHPSAQKIIDAAAQFRVIYDDLLTRVNDVMIENGESPIEYRKDYFPHFKDEDIDNVLKKLAKKINSEWLSDRVPTAIAGITHLFRPNKPHFSNAKQRHTDETKFDAVEGFDDYIDGISSLIFHTENIMKLRALESEIRYQKSDAGRRAEMDQLYEMDVPAAEFIDRMESIFSKDASLGNLVTWLRAYTDTLAGKKSIGDREYEYNLGRGIYDISRRSQRRISANMVAMNIKSALTNFIPITVATTQVSKESMIKALYDSAVNFYHDDGFDSTFLTNRKGSERLIRTASEKGVDLLSKPTQWIDTYASNVVTRAKYYENKAKGMTDLEAIKDADRFAANIIADRSKGAMPLVFEYKNPFAKMVTMFQLEVNNHLSYLAKDLPRDLGKDAKKQLALALLKYAIAAWMYNEGYEKLAGRRPQLDPLDMAYNIFNSVRDANGDFGKVTSKITEEVSQQIPFIGGWFGGGRLPTQAALPDKKNWDKIIDTSGETTAAVKKDALFKEMMKTLYYVPPAGGGQIKQTIEGVINLARGGSYNQNNDGEHLRFPVKQTPGNAIKSILFGQYAVPEAMSYFDRDGKPLSAKQTQAYKDAVSGGFDTNMIYQGFHDMKSIKSYKDYKGETIENSESAQKRVYIDALPLSPQERRQLYDIYDLNKTIKGMNDNVFEAYKRRMEREMSGK